MIHVGNQMKSVLLTAVAVLAFQPSAHASRSIIYPNTSSNFSINYDIRNEIALQDDQGRSAVLGKDGVLLLQGEDATKLSPDQLAHRRISKIEISYDRNLGKSYLGLMTAGSLLDSGSSREVRFGLPAKIEIDSNGYPIGIDSINSSAQDTGQNIGLSLNLTSPGKWEHYEYDRTDSCSIAQVRTYCHWVVDGHGHGYQVCHDEVFYIPGYQHVHVTGDRKTDGYTVALEAAARIFFNLNYDHHYTSAGPCYPR